MNHIKHTDIKNIIFNIHYFSTYIVTFGWFIYPPLVYIQYLVILSWYLNQNKCILTEIEHYFFNETFIGKGKKYIVPKYNRNILYVSCILATIYNNIFYSILLCLVFFIYYKKMILNLK